MKSRFVMMLMLLVWCGLPFRAAEATIPAEPMYNLGARGGVSLMFNPQALVPSIDPNFAVWPDLNLFFLRRTTALTQTGVEVDLLFAERLVMVVQLSNVLTLTRGPWKLGMLTKAGAEIALASQEKQANELGVSIQIGLLLGYEWWLNQDLRLEVGLDLSYRMSFYLGDNFRYVNSLPIRGYAQVRF